MRLSDKKFLRVRVHLVANLLSYVVNWENNVTAVIFICTSSFSSCTSSKKALEGVSQMEEKGYHEKEKE